MKQNKRNKRTETGRSMVEMLGVLAIIGVLSVAGIMGYRIAIAKHRANEIAQATSIAYQTLQAGQGVPADLLATGANIVSQDQATLTVTIADQNVCQALRTMLEGPWTIEGDCTD